HELPAKIQKKLDAKFAKLARLLDGRGEHKAHVIVTQERHLSRAEVTIQFYDHQLVGLGSDSDLFTLLSMALDKLDTQAVKQRSKWREKTRRKEASVRIAVDKTEASESAGPKSAPRRVYRVNHNGQRKPMTLDEALLEMDKRDYLVYRDAERDCLS